MHLREFWRLLKKPPKYHNVAVNDGEHHFDSKREERHYRELSLLQRAGKIAGLKVHPRFDLVVNGQRICAYEADFSYHSFQRDRTIVEDVKGVRTPAYRLKKKLMEAVHGIVVEEV